jgi:hypothetical protein
VAKDNFSTEQFKRSIVGLLFLLIKSSFLYFRLVCVISGFRRDVDEICARLRYYAALSGSSVPTFRDELSVPA